MSTAVAWGRLWCQHDRRATTYQLPARNITRSTWRTVHSVAGLASGVGSTTLPCVSIFAPAGNGFVIRELACWNTTATACVYKWQRFTAVGTAGSGLTEMEWDENGVAPTATAFDAHSVAPTAGLVISTCRSGRRSGPATTTRTGRPGSSLRLAPRTGSG